MSINIDGYKSRVYEVAAKLPVCGSQAAISASKGEAPVSVLTGLSSHFRLSSSQLPNIELSSSSTSPSLFLPTARLLLYPHFFLHSNSEICSFLVSTPSSSIPLQCPHLSCLLSLLLLAFHSLTLCCLCLLLVHLSVHLCACLFYVQLSPSPL